MNYSQRFRYGNLAQMYSKYREMFRKRLKQKEEGTVQRHFGAAAEKLKKNGRASTPPKRQTGKATQFPFAISCKDPDHEKKKSSNSSRPFARQGAGRRKIRKSPLTMETFQQIRPAENRPTQKQKDADEVEYVVTVEGNHARLKARVKS